MQAYEIETKISAQGNITLPQTFKNLYGCAARMILMLDENSGKTNVRPEIAEKKLALKQALAAVSQAGSFANIQNPVAWRNEIRADRLLFERED